MALNFARALSLTGQHVNALALYQRVVADRAERLGDDHAETREAAAAHVAGGILAQAPQAGGTGRSTRKRPRWLSWWRALDR